MRLKLQWDAYPRLQMSFLVCLTGASGLLASFALLHGGVSHMGVRYPLAIGIAYVVFLILLWLWLRTKAGDYIDAPNVDLPGSSGSGGGGGTFQGGGGGSGGGGASASFDAPGVRCDPPVSTFDIPNIPGADGVGEALGAADEAAVPILLTVVVAVALSAFAISAGYVIYVAPDLFAELLVDGALSVTLYRRLQGLDRSHWLETAIRKTVVPFAVAAIFLGAIGLGLAIYAPEAQTFSQALHHQKTGPTR